MNYLEFKNFYNCSFSLKGNLHNSEKTLFMVQKMFEDNLNDFYFNSNFNAALLFDSLQKEFIALIENKNLSNAVIVTSALNIAKKLLINRIALNQETPVVRNIHKKTDYPKSA